MSAWLGVALSLSLGWFGPNGLDAGDLRLVIASAGRPARIDSTDPKFLEWLKGSSPEEARARGQVLSYFVKCAFGDGFELSVGGLTMRGHYALLGQDPLARVRLRVSGGHGEGTRHRIRSRLLASDQGQWLSACLMAHVNTTGAHELISLRGNPSWPRARQAMFPDDAERWALGQPEGVFFADLFAEVSHSDEDLESFTVSLNLPSRYSQADAKWAPANARVGRVLDYLTETLELPPPASPPRVAKKLGTYHDHRQASFRATAPQSDPDYREDEVCVVVGQDGETALDDCAAAKSTLRPIFVHVPRLTNFEAATPQDPGAASEPLRVVAIGTEAIAESQRVPCADCIGPQPYLRAYRVPQDAPRDVPNPRPPGALSKLGPGQEVEVRFDFVADREVSPLQAPAEKAEFTALFRYRCSAPAGCVATVTREGGEPVGGRWPATGAAFRWLQAGPFAVATGAKLRARIAGAAGPAPELDAVGFVPGPPRCDGVLIPVAVGKDAKPSIPEKAYSTFFGTCRSPGEQVALDLWPAEAPK